MSLVCSWRLLRDKTDQSQLHSPTLNTFREKTIVIRGKSGNFLRLRGSVIGFKYAFAVNRKNPAYF